MGQLALVGHFAHAHGLSLSETDLWRNGLLRKFGSLTWRKRRSSHLEFPEHSGNPANSPWPLGRLHRPAVGSDLDMRDWSAAEEERSELSSQPSKIDSVPSASFDSLLCWGDGNSWDSASITNSSLCGPASSKTKDDALEVLLEQEKMGSNPESLSGWAESVFEGHLNSQPSCPTGIGELENLSFKSDLGESISRHISGAEGSRSAAESLHGKWPLQGGDATSAFKPSQTKTALKILYEILITLTKEEENGIVDAVPLTHCSERGLECHSSREGTLSLGVAELEKTEGQRHRQELARPAPQLSMLEEFQNCIEPHGVETFKACRQVLSPATGSQVTPQWGSELSPGQCKDLSVTDHLHSGDGELAEGTGTVAPVSWADRYVGETGLGCARNSRCAV
uniref:Uncharacterized protein n=1 Tax=Sphaerodactylus townsendi TaxID=933632 RepID=A0ACB8FRS6_9SAUR